MKKHIPNVITTLNLICGLISITLVLQYHIDKPNYYLVWAAFFIFIAAVFDYLDGTVARLLKAYSELGKQLDSLADLVSFGVAPGSDHVPVAFLSLHKWTAISWNEWNVIPYLALLDPCMFGAAVSQIQHRSPAGNEFHWLAYTGQCDLFCIHPDDPPDPGQDPYFIQLDFMVALFSNPRVLAVLTVFFSYLLISDFRLFSVKFKSMTWKENQHRYYLPDPFPGSSADLFDQCDTHGDPGIPAFVGGLSEEDVRKIPLLFPVSIAVQNSARGKPCVHADLVPVPVKCRPSVWILQREDKSGR